MWGPFFLAIIWVVIGWVVGYVRGREDGRAAERRDVRFTPVDKLEPREGYDSQPHYSPPLRDPRWEGKRPQQNSGVIPQGYTKRGDPYRHYDCDLKDLI